MKLDNKELLFDYMYQSMVSIPSKLKTLNLCIHTVPVPCDKIPVLVIIIFSAINLKKYVY